MYRVEIYHGTKLFDCDRFDDLEDAKFFAKKSTMHSTDRAYIKEEYLREVDGKVYTAVSGIWPMYKSGALVDVM